MFWARRPALSTVREQVDMDALTHQSGLALVCMVMGILCTLCNCPPVLSANVVGLQLMLRADRRMGETKGRESLKCQSSFPLRETVGAFSHGSSAPLQWGGLRKRGLVMGIDTLKTIRF